MPDISGSITTYTPSMAAFVARMFNDFNELWPGGFGGGVPYTEQRVHDWLDRSSAVADLIAVDDAGEAVGYCGVYPHQRDANACYVTILGVVPRVKGHGFGRRLLRHAVQLAMERGFTRLDLNTWAGNLDAVPLYKKTGLFWVPKTSVYMQNYLPALFLNPLAKAWFERHPDWYAAFRRALTQAPDEDTVDGMELYIYRFQVGDDVLVGEVDRHGWGICGVDSTLGGERLAIRTRLQNHTILMGIPNALTIIVENDASRDLDAVLNVEGFKGLHWTQPFPPHLVVPAGEKVHLTREFLADHTTRIVREGASELIHSRLMVGGQAIDLVTGGKIRPAVQAVYRQAYATAPSTRQAGALPRTITIDLINHAQTPLHGSVDSCIEGVADSVAHLFFDLEAKQIGAVEMALPPASVVSTAHILPFIERDGQRFPMPVVHLPVAPDMPGLAAVVEENDSDDLTLLTDLLDVHVRLRGGHIEIRRRSYRSRRQPIGFEAGPPFGMSLDGSLRYTYTVARDGDALLLTLIGDSLQFPGVRIRKVVRCAPGAPEIEHWVTLTALQPDVAPIGGRLWTGGYGGLTLDPGETRSRSFTPVNGRIVTCDKQLGWMDSMATPKAPERWAETWTAVEGAVDGELSALCWKPDGITKIEVSDGMLSSLEGEVHPLRLGESVEVAHVWYGSGFPSVHDLRQRWAQWVGPQSSPWKDLKTDPPTANPVEARWDKAHVIAGCPTRRCIQLEFAVPVRAPGELTLVAPPGWECAFVREGAEPTRSVSLAMPEPAEAGIVSLAVEITAPPDAAGLGQVALHYRGEYEIVFDAPLLATATAQVSVEPRELESRPVFHVDNGALSFDVLADSGGNLIHLEDAVGHAYLKDAFPGCRPEFFIPDFVGGLQPLVAGPQDDLFTKPEPILAEPVSEGMWKGVQVTWAVQGQEALRGQRFVITYLVIPGVAAIRARVTHCNPTLREVPWAGCFLAVLHAEMVTQSTPLAFTTPGRTHPWRRLPAPHGFVGSMNPHQAWSWAEVEDRSLGFLALSEGSAAPAVFQFSSFAGAFLMGSGRTVKNSEVTLELALVLNRPSSEAQTWIRALAASLPVR